MARDLDVVLHGATGFVGRITARHLAQHAEGACVGLSGRSLERLEQVREALGPSAGDWPLLVADAGDPSSLRALARSTAVVATTVGPYARHGLPLVLECAAAGTHYADLTGEVLFVRRSIDAAEALAASTGARIVHACGFDSVPSDLGVLLLHQAAGELAGTTLVVESVRGGVSGGTIAAVRDQLDQARRDRTARRLLLDPYALSPDRDAEPDLGPQPDAFVVGHDSELGWFGPFPMAPFNTRVVRRSNALTGWGYGRSFRYREVIAAGPAPVGPLVAPAVTVGVVAMAAGQAFPPTRALLDRLLPAPGRGPSEKAQREGRFQLRTHTVTPSGQRWTATVSANRDPGYSATAAMLGQSALALAAGDRLPDHAGVLTPATGIGQPLVDRLRAQGFVLDVAPG